ncbi:MAG: PspA/IM30 family protein [Armatimonadota bacterium]|nr:PspA/IM30 family protein [Armatimonadota bacterium]
MFKRISNLIRGFLGLFISGIEKQNPEMLLEVEKENLREQIKKYNQGLATHAGLCERLMTQVKKLEVQERELRAKTTANLKAGNRDLAGQLALQLQQVTSQLTENRKQLEQAEETYKELEKARNVTVDAAKAKIEVLRYAIGDMKVKKATAEMMEMAGGMLTSIGGAGDTLNRLEDMVNEERERAAGRARVARGSINTHEFEMKEAEQEALADQALADFAAKEGIQLEPSLPTADSTAATTTETTKSMGPAAETNI